MAVPLFQGFEILKICLKKTLQIESETPKKGKIFLVGVGGEGGGGRGGGHRSSSLIILHAMFLSRPNSHKVMD